MSIRFKRRATYLISILISAAALCGQTANKVARGSGSLRQHYDDAQELQRAGKLRAAMVIPPRIKLDFSALETVRDGKLLLTVASRSVTVVSIGP
jgi:hypothetical protein